MKGVLWTKKQKNQKRKKKNVTATAKTAAAAKNRAFGPFLNMDYKLVRSKRRTLSVQIIDQQVIVRAPLLLPKGYIDKFVTEKQQWIDRTIHKVTAKPKLKNNELYFLGSKHSLVFGHEQFMTDQAIGLKTLGQTVLERKKALEKFLSSQTRELVSNFLEKYQGYNYRSIKFSFYLSKWGSCSYKNELTFNNKLSMCPPEVIEYVVVHELCHLEIKNHSKNFWRKVESIFPNYKNCRKWLRDHRWYI